MPLSHYGVVAGRVVGSKAEGGSDSPHFQIRIDAGGTEYRVAVNVLSKLAPSELLYLADESFEHPLVNALPDLPDGFTAISSAPGGIALDFIRGNLFDRQDLTAMPATTPGPDNDLADKLGHFVTRATADPSARVYAFGERWGPEASVPDKIFGFSPGNGIHDIHMNQGNVGQFKRDDGVWQDGGLLLSFADSGQWVAIFLAFQSQAWHTDDVTGHTVSDIPNPGPGPVPDPAEPDQAVRIVAALVNAVGPAPEHETATLINTTDADLNLEGWALLDRLKHRMPLEPIVLPAGATTQVQLREPVQLGNKGGLLTLLNPAGLKVDGVAYTQDQADAEGRTIVF